MRELHSSLPKRGQNLLRNKGIQIAAKLLLVNINNIETSKEYASGAKVTDLAANLDYIPPSLLVF